jgi:4-carboxymuconolactone decarboxylase
MLDQNTYDKGREIRAAVLGEVYVNAATAGADDVNKPFQDLVTEYCWGAVWGRDELALKTHSMLNLAMISVLNRPQELRAHIRGALTNGVTRDEIREVFNAGSGATNASRDKFPRSILPRTFDYGFTTGFMVKDVRLYLDEAKMLGVSVEVAEAVARLWEFVIDELGPESDFTAAIKPIELAAGVVVGGQKRD